MNVKVADALLDALREDDDEPLDDGGWLVGRDVLLEDVFPTAATTATRRRRVA
jgi:hypothetical protein